MTLPLDGIRVLDLSRLLPGGFCSMMLADYGAEVIKVEDTGPGDYVRWNEPKVAGVPDSAASTSFLALNRNKTSIQINLKAPEGPEVLFALVRDADVLLDSNRPGVMDRLGVGYDRLTEHNPGLIQCSITGYGQDGPLRDRAGHDMNYLGLIGLLDLSGDVDGAPTQAGGQIADLGGGALMACFGILAALRERDRSGKGQFVDVSMTDGALSWLGMVAAGRLGGGPSPRRGHEMLSGSLICYRPYPCADGWVSLGALEPKFWAAWCRGVDREDLIERQFEAPGSDAHAEVVAIFATRTRAEWAAFGTEVDCCLEPVLDVDEMLASEHVKARKMVVEIDQPGATEPVRLLGAPVKLSRTPADETRLPGPELGQHTDEVLRAAGFDDERISALREAGAIK